MAMRAGRLLTKGGGQLAGAHGRVGGARPASESGPPPERLSDPGTFARTFAARSRSVGMCRRRAVGGARGRRGGQAGRQAGRQGAARAGVRSSGRPCGEPSRQPRARSSIGIGTRGARAGRGARARASGRAFGSGGPGQAGAREEGG
ncbi:hypothetical protein CDV55_100835 [Aspergillus turcosus]|nr:hypothetical protein CDV55_100835 [Aspergillus turcosus]